MKRLESVRKFVSPEVVFGIGSLELAGKYVLNYEAGKVLVISDPGVKRAGWTGRLLKNFDSLDIKYALYDNISPNPRDEQVTAGAELYNAENCDAIVAIGGGSPMDCAKAIGVAISNRGNILEYEGVDNIEIPMPPLICIPTTAGTASEVSQFAILLNKKQKKKIAIISKTVVPDVAIIDPQTLVTKDAYLTACTGVDALVHAIEAYVSTGSSPLTDIHALEAIRLISENLVKSVNDLTNLEYRFNMALGSLEAGFAFSNASLGAAHALAHSLGGQLDLVHGECTAMLIESVIDYNYESATKKYKKIAECLGLNALGLNDAECKKELINKITSIKTDAGITRKLSQLSVTKNMIKELSANAMKDACIVTNPRRPTLKDIEALYENAF